MAKNTRQNALLPVTPVGAQREKIAVTYIVKEVIPEEVGFQGWVLC